MKFKPCVLLEITGSVKWKGKTSLESSHSKQNLFWGELAEFLGWQWKSAHSLGPPNSSARSFTWQVLTGDRFMSPHNCCCTGDRFFSNFTKNKARHRFFFLFFVFFGCIQGLWKFLGLGLKPMPQQWPKPLQWQRQILNPLHHEGTLRPIFKKPKV